MLPRKISDHSDCPKAFKDAPKLKIKNGHFSLSLYIFKDLKTRH